MWRTIFTGLVAGLVLITGLWVVSSALAADPSKQVPNLWQDINISALPPGLAPDVQQVTVTQGRYLRLDVPAMQALLSQAPMERFPGSRLAPDALGLAAQGIELVLPLPDGSMQRFSVVESPIMAPELAARYPEIKTYAGQGLDDPAAAVRLDMTRQGFHAMLLRPAGAVYIDPLYSQQNDVYVSYDKQNLAVDLARIAPELPPQVAAVEGAQLAPVTSSGTQLRTYRLAVAATGEYTAYHGGTVAAGLAAIITAINRVDAIYETEVAVRMVLVANNDSVVYTDKDTDPYSNSSGLTMLDQNQETLDAVIGSDNYDIGHVFSTGGGGVATIGVTCRSDIKARGVTGLSKPTGDAFWVDYVAHEMGHQFSAYHTFNGDAGSCGRGNRVAQYAFEPGSGSTIMSYAGICGTQNLQPNSDPYFHSISFDQIVAYTTTGSGNSCAATTPTGNQPPANLSGSNGYTIPFNTPFVMIGSASDPNGDPLTYQWEQLDTGPVSGAPPPVAGYVTPPHFRSFPPTTSPERIFPRLQDVISNTVSLGEILPSTATTLHFRFTVRDNRLGGGGVRNAGYSVIVTNTAGPFQVTAPDKQVTWYANTLQRVTWDVAKTDTSPVSCTGVDIRLSTDGGYTYPDVLAEAVPNDGSQLVTIPGVTTTTARVLVACADNIFFDISNTDFTIASDPYFDLRLGKTALPNPVYVDDVFTYTLAASNAGNTLLPDVVITDTLPAEVTYLSDSAGCTTVSSSVLRCELGDLPAGEQQAIQVVTQAPSEVAPLTNQARASFNGVDDNPENNTATLDITMLDSTDLNLQLAAIATPGSLYAGQAFTYTVTVHNQSRLPVTGVVVTDTLPLEAGYLGSSPGCTSLSRGSLILRCELGNLSAGASQSIIITATAPDQAMVLTNQAVAVFAGEDAYLADNQVSLNTSVLNSSDLALQLSAPAGPVPVATPVTYVITVTNQGPSPAADLILVDDLPAGTGFLSASPGCSYAANQVTCSLAGLAAGGSQVYMLTLSAPATTGLLENQAQISAATYDPVPANNQAQATTTVWYTGYFPFISR